SQILCHEYPNQQRKGSYAIFAITLPAISTLIVFLRLFARWTVAHKLWWDDYVTMLALVCP
ncbi:integral membrane protein, partial [Colletotrichum orchidophilum]